TTVKPGDPTPTAITIKGPLEGIQTLVDLISKIMTFLIPASALVLFVVLLWGGFDYLQSQGSPEKIKGAQAKITAGFVGFALLIMSFLITRLISFIFFREITPF
ncbi:MAG: hypothetical protein Q7S61_04610, partial [bacterium]|nr:hypothetical protein [bacterium]